MIDRRARALAFAAAVIACLFAIALASGVHADYSTISHTDFAVTINAKTIAPSGVYTQGVTALPGPFTPLIRTTTQSVQIQGTGTSPNYKVQMLVTLDGTNYVKPEIGGELGTFTDQNLHIIPLGVPLSVGHELVITELGGANSIKITAGEISQ